MSYTPSFAAAHERDEAYALQASIAVWIEDHTNLVAIAQRLALAASDLGLWDPALHHPFQIVPTDMFEEEGMLAHELYVNIDHPAWGYYQIKIDNANKFLLDSPPPKSPHDAQEFTSEAEALAFIEALGATLDMLYELDEASECGSEEAVNAQLERMLAAYHAAIDPALAAIKKEIEGHYPHVRIQASQTDQEYVHRIPHRWDLALFYPETWVLESSVYHVEDERGTQKLRDKIKGFARAEAAEAAFLYVAQKILAQAGWRVEVVTDSTPEEGDLTGIVGMNPDTNFAFVRPVLHASRVWVTREHAQA